MSDFFAQAGGELEIFWVFFYFQSQSSSALDHSAIVPLPTFVLTETNSWLNFSKMDSDGGGPQR